MAQDGALGSDKRGVLYMALISDAAAKYGIDESMANIPNWRTKVKHIVRHHFWND